MNEKASNHDQHCLPLAYSEVARWTGTQVATLSIGTAVTAGGLSRATFVDVLATSTELFVLEAGRAHALVAPQGVVTGGSSADVSTEAFIFICRENQKTPHMWYWAEVSMEEFGSGTLTQCWPAGPHLGSREGKAGGSGWGGKGNKRERCGDRCGLSPYGERTWSLRSSASGSVLEDGILRTSRLQSSSEANGSVSCSTGASGEECRDGSWPRFRDQGGRAGSSSVCLCFRSTQQWDDSLQPRWAIFLEAAFLLLLFQHE